VPSGGEGARSQIPASIPISGATRVRIKRLDLGSLSFRLYPPAFAIPGQIRATFLAMTTRQDFGNDESIFLSHSGYNTCYRNLCPEAQKKLEPSGANAVASPDKYRQSG